MLRDRFLGATILFAIFSIGWGSTCYSQESAAEKASRKPQVETQKQRSEQQEAASRQAKETLTAGKHAVVFENNAIKGYVTKLPEGYSPEKAYPMIVAFHGAVGSAETVYRRWAEASEGFILVCPQGTARMGWQIGTGQLKSIMACIKDVQERFSVDADRIYLTGHSMGGHVCWNLATFHADKFAAVAPTASTPMFADKLDKVLSLPLYVVHGRNDHIVGIAKNQHALKYINGHGGSMILAIIEDTGHGFVTDQLDDIIKFFKKHR